MLIPSNRLGATVALLVLLATAACSAADGRSADSLTEGDRRRIAAEVERRLREATDLRAGGDMVARMLSIYADSGPVVSASGGQVTVERDSLERAVRTFWVTTGRNMRNPEWRWGPMHVDVLSPDAAVVTGTYRIPHLTPQGAPHVLGGAWTAVFVRRGGEWVVVQEHLSDDTGALSPTP